MTKKHILRPNNVLSGKNGNMSANNGTRREPWKEIYWTKSCTMYISHKEGISFFSITQKSMPFIKFHTLSVNLWCSLLSNAMRTNEIEKKKEKRQNGPYSGHFFYTQHRYIWILSCQSKRKFQHCTNHDVPTQCNMDYISKFWLIRLYRVHHCISTTNK